MTWLTQVDRGDLAFRVVHTPIEEIEGGAWAWIPLVVREHDTRWRMTRLTVGPGAPPKDGSWVAPHVCASWTMWPDIEHSAIGEELELEAQYQPLRNDDGRLWKNHYFYRRDIDLGIPVSPWRRDRLRTVALSRPADRQEEIGPLSGGSGGRAV